MMAKIIEFFRKRPILKHLLLAGCAFLGFILIVVVFLRFVTRHGEAIELPDFTRMQVEDAMLMAKEQGFELIVIDSVFELNKKGGLILAQNPLPGERVKRNRKVYLSITKSKADEIPSGRLPILYGKSYERKSRELKQGFEIFTKVIDTRFDAGPEDYILAVVYEGDTIVSANERKTDVMIEKGATLGCIISKSSGGEIEVPNLLCKTYNEALFYCKGLRIIMVGQTPGDAANSDSYIHLQEPAYFLGAKMLMGDTVRVATQAIKPDFCD